MNGFSKDGHAAAIDDFTSKNQKTAAARTYRVVYRMRSFDAVRTHRMVYRIRSSMMISYGPAARTAE
jgi:hypothetical protein